MTKVFLKITMKLYSNGWIQWGKAVAVSFLLFTLGCSFQPKQNQKKLTVLLGMAPKNLHPYHSTDSSAQLINNFWLSALVKTDSHLNLTTDLAHSWTISPDKKKITFKFLKNSNHQKAQIDAKTMKICIKNYLKKDSLFYAKSQWDILEKIETKNNFLIFKLKHPDPFFIENLKVIKFFTNEKREICSYNSKKIYGTRNYSLRENDLYFKNEIHFDSKDKNLPTIKIEFVKDEITKVLTFLKKDVDLAYNAFSHNKWSFLKKKGFKTIEAPGSRISYLAFNLDRFPTNQIEIRKAIAYGINRPLIIEKKMKNANVISDSFLPKSHPAYLKNLISYDLEKSKKWVKKFKKKTGLKEITLEYLTTPFLIGKEKALSFQYFLKEIGINLVIRSVEPAIFFTLIRTGKYHLYSSTWVGVTHGGIFETTLKTGEPRNRVHYSNPQMDQWIQSALRETDQNKRNKFLIQIQKKMIDDLPYFPLWKWNIIMMAKPWISLPSKTILSPEGSLDALTKVRYK